MISLLPWHTRIIGREAQSALFWPKKPHSKIFPQKPNPSKKILRRPGYGARKGRHPSKRAEMSAAQIFNRVTGAATHADWKHGIFSR